MDWRPASGEFAPHIGEGIAVAHDSFDFTGSQIIEGLGDAFVFVCQDADASEDFRGQGSLECSAGEVFEVRDAFDAVCHLRRGHAGGHSGCES